MSDQRASSVASEISPRALRWGVTAWAILGLAGVLALTGLVFSVTASISVPVVIAVVLGFLFAPSVTALEKYHIPRSLGAALVLLGLMIVFVGLIVLVVFSIGNALADVGDSVDEGVAAVEEWAVELDVPPETADSISTSVTKAVPSAATGLASSVGSGLSSTIASLVMIVMALYICYLMLADGGEMMDWIGAHLGVPKDVGMEMIQDMSSAIRGYFKGAFLLGLVTGVATTLGLWLVGAPLPVFVGVITLVLSFIPYIGAFVAGAFGVIIAFAAGGPELGLYALLVVLFVQIVLQTVVQAPLMGNALSMNAVLVFILTMLGGVVAGALGAMLAAPILSAILGMNKTLANYHEKQAGGGGAAVAAPQES